MGVFKRLQSNNQRLGETKTLAGLVGDEKAKKFLDKLGKMTPSVGSPKNYVLNAQSRVRNIIKKKVENVYGKKIWNT